MKAVENLAICNGSILKSIEIFKYTVVYHCNSIRFNRVEAKQVVERRTKYDKGYSAIRNENEKRNSHSNWVNRNSLHTGVFTYPYNLSLIIYSWREYKKFLLLVCVT